ncbi:MAG: transposase family protein [Devosia sp.]|nr:transposase family protein [Devosia sp.]
MLKKLSQYERLALLTGGFEPMVRQAFFEAIADIRSKITLRLVIEHLELRSRRQWCRLPLRRAYLRDAAPLCPVTASCRPCPNGQACAVAGSRSGSKVTTCRASRSQTMVPYRWLRRQAQSSMPITRRGVRGTCPNTPARKIPRDLDDDARDVAQALADTPAYVRSRHRRKKVEVVRPPQAHPQARSAPPAWSSGARGEFLLAVTAQNLRKLAKLRPMTSFA